MEVGKWIDIKKENPTETGWYQIKTKIGEYEAAYSSTASGKLVWVVPDISIITHWRRTLNK